MEYSRAITWFLKISTIAYRFFLVAGCLLFIIQKKDPVCMKQNYSQQFKSGHLTIINSKIAVAM